MAATVLINRWTGAVGSPTQTNITSLNTRATTDDGSTPTGSPITNPLPIPGAGQNLSYWVVTRLYVTSPPATSINNIKFYTDGGSFGAGVYGSVLQATAYIQAVGSQGISGTALNTVNYSASLASYPVSYSTVVVGSPISVSGSTGGSGTGHLGNFIIYQLAADNTASPGPSTQRTFTWQYDET